jgi:hypothetical protein
MQPDQFKALKYGNVVQDKTGTKFVVLHVVRDDAGNALHAGLIPAIDATAAPDYILVSTRSSETFLSGRTVG